MHGRRHRLGHVGRALRAHSDPGPCPSIFPCAAAHAAQGGKPGLGASFSGGADATGLLAFEDSRPGALKDHKSKSHKRESVDLPEDQLPQKPAEFIFCNQLLGAGQLGLFTLGCSLVAIDVILLLYRELK